MSGLLWSSACPNRGIWFILFLLVFSLFGCASQHSVVLQVPEALLKQQSRLSLPEMNELVDNTFKPIEDTTPSLSQPIQPIVTTTQQDRENNPEMETPAPVIITPPSTPQLTPIFSSFGSSGSTSSGEVPAPPAITYAIDDVVIHGTQTSILKDSGTGSLTSDYSGKLFHVSVIGTFPEGSVQAVLDTSIPLTIVEANTKTIQLNWQAKNIPDYYLVGPHLLTLSIGSQSFKAKILFGQPDNVAFLSPEIEAVNFIKSPENQVVEIQLQGNHLMRNPNFAQLKLNNQIMQYHTTLNAEDKVAVHISVSGMNIDETDSHYILYSNPFGSVFLEL